MSEIRYITMDFEQRTLSVPPGEEVLGVYNDRDVEVKYFKIPRYFEDIDFSLYTIWINFRPPGNSIVEGVLAENVSLVDDYLTFEWTIPHKVCSASGTALFQVCMKLMDLEVGIVKEFNSTFFSGKVLPGIEPDGSAIPDDPAIVTSVEQAAASAQQSAITAAYYADRTQQSIVTIAPEYDEEAYYSVGDYVMHNNDLYICSQAPVGPGEWYAPYWTKVVLTDRMKALEQIPPMAGTYDLIATYDILPGPVYYTATITGSGSSTNCYVINNATDVKYYRPGSFTFQAGDQIAVYANGPSGGQIIFDGNIYNVNSKSFTLSNNDINIQLAGSSVTITTSESSSPIYFSEAVVYLTTGDFDAAIDKITGGIPLNVIFWKQDRNNFMNSVIPTYMSYGTDPDSITFGGMDFLGEDQIVEWTAENLRVTWPVS